MKANSICLITPSFNAGGAERVLSEIANSLAQKEEVKVHLIILVGGSRFFKLDSRIKIHEPGFDYKKYPRLIFTLKLIKYLRITLKTIKPRSVLTFGGKYNAFVILSAFNLKVPIYISERSRPSISYGFFLDRLNPIMYKKAAGIIAQTQKAKEILHHKTKHSNIKVIGNPIRKIDRVDIENRKNIILNVGRFISSKNQKLLIDYFIDLKLSNWQLIFLGEGPLFEKIKNSDKALKNADTIIFEGNMNNIDDYYKTSSVFAFTSVSEGFPNALAEAMSAGLACISFNCEAGPSEIIDHAINGYLIDNYDHRSYKEHLNKLCDNDQLRKALGEKARKKIDEFEIDKIVEKYYGFIIS